MPVGFGFSVGDFIAGINLLIEIVKSFSETHGAKADYQELGRELISLKNALDGIQALSLNTAQAAQISAVNAAVDACRLSVDGFVQRNNKFRSLGCAPVKQWSLAAFKNGVLGVKWAILKKNKVVKFRADVQAHSNGIQMLLATLQVQVFCCPMLNTLAHYDQESKPATKASCVPKPSSEMSNTKLSLKALTQGSQILVSTTGIWRLH